MTKMQKSLYVLRWQQEMVVEAIQAGVDFLVKPFSPERIVEALVKIRYLLNKA